MTATNAAQAAALIRKEIKAGYPGLKFTCRSENYSMGSSINVGLVDQPREVFEAIKTLAAKYQYGHFDGMTDTYHMSNSRRDIPQAKHVFVDNEMSDAKREEMFQLLRTKFAGGDQLPGTYDQARNENFMGEWVSTQVWRLFTGALAA